MEPASEAGHPTRPMATQKLPPFVYQFYPYPNYPRIPGVQVDLFWNGSESEVYNAVWRGHDGGNALKDEVTPTPPRLRTWPALEMIIVIFEN